MKKRKFLLFILGACLALPAMAAQDPLSKTTNLGVYCEAMDAGKGKSDSDISEKEQTGKKKKGATATAAID